MRQRTKFIIVEGLDGAGKTTYIEKLKAKLEADGKSVYVFHNTSKHERTVEGYKETMSQQEAQLFDYVIGDRAFIGPFVGPFFFQGQDFSIINPKRLIDEVINYFDMKIITNSFKAEDFEIIADRRPDEYKENFKNVYQMFLAIINMLFTKNMDTLGDRRILKYFGVFRDDFKQDKYIYGKLTGGGNE